MPKVYGKRVPNLINSNSKILVVGESPGFEEEKIGEPFVGESGKLLIQTFEQYGVSRDQLSLANLCQYRPYDNKFENLEGSKELHEGKTEISNIIWNQFKGNVIVGLGAKPLEFLTEKQSIFRWRGSILKNVFTQSKTICTFHPAFILRSPLGLPIFSIDIKRIVEDSKYLELNYTKRTYYTHPNSFNLVEWTQMLCVQSEISVDIESAWDEDSKQYKIICIGFSPSPFESYVFPFNEETRPFIVNILLSESSKIFHFGTYDKLVLAQNGIRVTNGNSFDTHIAAHIIEPEFRRTLDFLTSVYTREPYYKKEGRADLPTDTKAWGAREDKNSIFIYNAKDTAVTFEIKQAQETYIKRRGLEGLFEYEMEMLEVAQHISETGLLVDKERIALLIKASLFKWKQDQMLLAGLTQEVINVNSPKEVPKLLYVTLGLPERRNEGKVTADEDAIVSLIGFCLGEYDKVSRADAKLRWQIKLTVCKLILSIRQTRKLLSSYLLAGISVDGRLRSVYNVGATETGRWSASLFVDETGVNSQTFPRGKINIPENMSDDLSGMLDNLKEEVEVE